jgi:hypothetical protein
MNAAEIKLDTDTSAKLNLNEQLDPPFLLSETGTMRAKAIGRIVNTNIIDAAERDIMKDISNNNLVLKGFEKQLADIDEELEQYCDIEKEEENIKDIESLLARIDKLNSNFVKIHEFKDKIELINNQIEQNTRVLSNLKNIPNISELFNDLREKSSLSQRLYSFKDKLSGINNSISKDAFILDKLRDLENVNESIKTLESKTSLCRKLSDLNQKQIDIISKIKKGNEYMAQLKIELKRKISEYKGGASKFTSSSVKPRGSGMPSCSNIRWIKARNLSIILMESRISVLICSSCPQAKANLSTHSDMVSRRY